MNYNKSQQQAIRHKAVSYTHLAKKYQVEERKQQEIRNEISIACKSEKLEQFESHLEMCIRDRQNTKN